MTQLSSTNFTSCDPRTTFHTAQENSEFLDFVRQATLILKAMGRGDICVTARHQSCNEHPVWDLTSPSDSIFLRVPAPPEPGLVMIMGDVLPEADGPIFYVNIADGGERVGFFKSGGEANDNLKRTDNPEVVAAARDFSALVIGSYLRDQYPYKESFLAQLLDGPITVPPELAGDFPSTGREDNRLFRTAGRASVGNP